jgi:hypothetical protein
MPLLEIVEDLVRVMNPVKDKRNDHSYGKPYDGNDVKSAGQGGLARIACSIHLVSGRKRVASRLLNSSFKTSKRCADPDHF